MSRDVPGSPEALLAAARVLLGEGSDLRGRARQTVAVARSHGWEGTAALASAARAEQSARSLRAQAEQLDALARGTTRYAERLRAAQQRAAVLRRRQEQARAQLDLLERVPCHRLADPGREARRASLSREVGLLEARVGQVRSSLHLDVETLVGVLGFDPAGLLPAWALGGVAAGQAIKSGKGLAGRGRTTAALGRSVARSRAALRGGDLTTWLRHLGDADSHIEKLRGRAVPEPGRVVRLLPVRVGRLLSTARTAGARVALPMTAVDGARDVATGGGYDGWRDPASRVMGGVGAAGALTLLVGSGGTLAAVAGAAVLAYGAWRLGNAVWDNRRRIGAFGTRVWQLWQRGARRQAQVAGEVLSRAVTSVRSAARLGASVADDVGDGVRRVLRRVHLPQPSWPSLGRAG